MRRIVSHHRRGRADEPHAASAAAAATTRRPCRTRPRSWARSSRSAAPSTPTARGRSSLESFDEGWNQGRRRRRPRQTADTPSPRRTNERLDALPRGRRRARAKLEKHVTAPVKVTTVDDSVSLSIVRARPASRHGHRRGEVSLKPDRSFELQWLDGSKWKKLGAGQGGRARPHQDRLRRQGLALLPPRRRRRQGHRGRNLAAPRGSRRGPKKLGKKVIYVNTDEFKDPVVRGAPYEANAVLVTDGQISKPFRRRRVRGAGQHDRHEAQEAVQDEVPSICLRSYGLPEDKTWVLLANFQDRTLVRNQIAYNVGAGLDGLRWTPRGTFVELYLNGEYKGAIRSRSRSRSTRTGSTSTEQGHCRRGRQALRREGVPGFFGDHQIPYAFKDPDERKTGKKKRKASPTTRSPG